MTITLELKPELGAHLRHLARGSGLSLNAYLAKLIEDMTSRKSHTATAGDLLESWAKEDETEDPEELAKRCREWETHKQAMNESHTSDRVLFP